MKRISISVINDLVTDQRLHRMAGTLIQEGFEVKLIGRNLKNSLSINDAGYSFIRFKMIFKNGPFFYLFFNFRLLISFLFAPKPDLLISIDLDTLPANYLISRWRKTPLIYDSHEYFTEVPELIHRHFTRGIWEWLERKIVPKVKYAISVSDSISKIYSEKYGVDFVTIRNVPYSKQVNIDTDFQQKYTAKFKIIYQGSLNIGRGIELIIQAMTLLEDTQLLIVGEGDIEGELKKLMNEKHLNDSVLFLGKIHPNELHRITSQCHLGVTLEEDMGLSYRYSLPNKLFDYIQARIPVLCSDLPEMARLVEENGIGERVLDRDWQLLSDQIMKMLKSKELNTKWKANLEKAAIELCWEKEESKFINIIHQAIIP